jgi:hypothetical protein
MTALASTRFLINFQTGPMSRPAIVPGYLRRDFDPALLGAWLVWLVMWVMTVEDKVDALRGAFDSAVFMAVWTVVIVCLFYSEVKNGRLILC